MNNVCIFFFLSFFMSWYKRYLRLHPKSWTVMKTARFSCCDKSPCNFKCTFYFVSQNKVQRERKLKHKLLLLSSTQNRQPYSLFNTWKFKICYFLLFRANLQIWITKFSIPFREFKGKTQTKPPCFCQL